MFFEFRILSVTKKDRRKEGVKRTVGSRTIIKDPTVAVI